MEWYSGIKRGDPKNWAEEKIIYNPEIIPEDANEMLFNTYLGDRGVHAVLHHKVSQLSRGVTWRADFDTVGHVLSNRAPRGLPATTGDGEIIKVQNRLLHGDIELDTEQFDFAIHDHQQNPSAKTKVVKPAMLKDLNQYTAMIAATPKEAAKASERSTLRPRVCNPKDEPEVSDTKGSTKANLKIKEGADSEDEVDETLLVAINLH